MKTSLLFQKSYDFTKSNNHVQVNQGGTSSGKTYAIEQVLFCLAAETSKLIITVCGQDIPNLKAGALRDALNIYNDNPEIKNAVKSYNKTDRIFEFHNGSLIEFKSYDNSQDAKSGKRDYLFVNEANGISWEIYTELALRTKKKVFIDYNPNEGFWAHENLIGRPGVELIISDHRDNPFLPDAIREKIEDLKRVDVELWKVYARGLTGRVEGLVFTNWFMCDGIPAEAKLLSYGLDFGFTNDETGAIEVFIQDGELWVNEIMYETGLTNPDISDKLSHWGVKRNDPIIADSAEPKSIEELKRLGWYVIPAKKGSDSVKNSIDILKRYKINVTRASVNLRKELVKYKWRTDNTGKAINEPVDKFNHLIDPLRYIALNKLKINNLSPNQSRMPYKPGQVVDPLLNGFL